nr:phage tail tape measure protein [Sporomusa sphaeroides]
MERSMEASKKAARDWSKSHADSARTFLEAASTFSGAGLNDIQAIEGSRSALALARATMGTASEAANVMTDSYENFGDKSRDVAAEMTRLADIMAMNQNLYKFKNLNQLTEGLKNAAPAAIQGRASFEELNVIIGALNNTSLAGAPAGTAYAATMRQMIKASRDLGFTIAKNANGGTDMIGTLENMRDRFGDFSLMSDDMKLAFQEAFGDEGLRLIMLLGGKLDNLKESMAAMDNAAGTAAAGMARMEKTSSNRWKITLNNIENVKEMLGEKLAPVIDQTIPKVIMLVDMLGGFIEANPGMAQAAVVVAAIGTGLMMIVAPLLSVVSGLFILTGYSGMGLVKIVQGFVWFKNVLGSGVIVARLVSIGGGIKTVLLFGWDLIRMASSLGLMLAKAAQMGIMFLYRSLITAIPAVWSFTIALLANPITWIILGIVALGGAIYACIVYWDDIRYAAVTAWVWIVDAWGNGVAFIQTSVNGALGWVSGMATTFFTSGAALWDAFTGGIRSTLSGPAEVVRAGLQSVRNLLPFSDAKEGPLSRLTRSGQALMATLAEGVHIEAPNLHAAVTDNLDFGGFVQRLSERQQGQNGRADGQPGTLIQISKLIIKVEKIDSVEEFKGVMKQIAMECGGDA